MGNLKGGPSLRELPTRWSRVKASGFIGFSATLRLGSRVQCLGLRVKGLWCVAILP